jgi:hypothetical protein
LVVVLLATTAPSESFLIIVVVLQGFLCVLLFFVNVYVHFEVVIIFSGILLV